MTFHESGEPNFIIHKSLLENEARPLLKIGQESGAKAHVTHEMSLEAHHVFGFFVDPHHARELFDNALIQLPGLVFGVGLKIEDEDILAAEALVPRIHEPGDSQKDLNARIFVVFGILAFLFGLFLLLLLLLLFLHLLDEFVRFIVFLLLLVFAERLAVFFHESGDFFAFQIEECVFVDFFPGDSAGLIVFDLFLGAGAGVVFFDCIDLLLIRVDLFKKRLQIGKLDLRLDREIENTFADRVIGSSTSDVDVVEIRSAVNFKPVRHLQPIQRPVIVIVDFMRDPGESGFFGDDEVRLPVEKTSHWMPVG